MGLYDTMQQGKQPMQGSTGQPMQNAGNQLLQAGNGGSFAQKQQQRANPMMRSRPAMSGGFNQQNSMSQTPNAMTGARPVMGMQPGMQGGSRDMMQQKMQQLKAQQAAVQGQPATVRGSYNELASKYPNLQENRQYGEKIGQDMSWMDRPGALQMSANPADYNKPEPQGPQSGLSPLQSPYERQIQESKPDAVMGAVQSGPLSGMTSLYGTTGRPQVMDRGLGPSDGMTEMFGGQSLQQMQPQQQPVVMDENGLEPRRGPR